MFRRIEVLYKKGSHSYHPSNDNTWHSEQAFWKTEWLKTGLNSLGPALNYYNVKAPTGIRTKKAVRFYFTEHGWKAAGRHILGFIKRNKWEHRVVAIKERDAEVIYQDEYQVVVRPKRRTRS